MEVYFVNRSLEKKNAKEIGMMICGALKEYIKINGPIEDKVRKASILTELKKTADKLYELPDDNMLKNIFFTAEIKEILETSIPKKYKKSRLTGPQRIEFTLEAEKVGLVAYYVMEDDINKCCLVIGGSCDEKVDKKVMTDKQKELFSHYMGIQFTNEKFLEEVEMLNLNDTLDFYIDEIKRYGYHGFKRRNRILTDEIVTYVKKLPKYIEIIENQLENKLIQPKGKTDKGFTIHSKLYIPENDSKEFISIDIKAAIFTAYHQYGIIKESSWIDFLKNFTTSKFLMASKKFRLEIFGKLDVKKIHNIMIPNTIIDVWNELKTNYADILLSIEGDELVLSPPNCKKVMDELIKLKFPDHVGLTCYRINYYDISGSKIYKKTYMYPIAKRFDLKCATKELYTALYQILNNMIK
ncbi:MAG: hypothetical protein Edafosvirus13_16 [Edafosvirus sp.]|uniref:Uncharacterized protein n=1 Tax=Edafosvirus sp. TaxID=2487765 RepID=A0A3G4ZWT3_9VIRU|nr:MAG: hypothetical protein Edafosvirus13_16 [Edafosvirus sp.]